MLKVVLTKLYDVRLIIAKRIPRDIFLIKVMYVLDLICNECYIYIDNEVSIPIIFFFFFIYTSLKCYYKIRLHNELKYIILL